MNFTYRWKRRLAWIFSNSQSRRWLTQGIDTKKLWDKLIDPQHLCLDVGCGGGTYAIEHFLNKGAKCLLVDLNEKNLALARRQIEETGANQRAEFFLGPLENLPPHYGVFDRIQCLEVLEHLEDPRTILRSMHTRASTDALLMVSVPHPPEWFPNDSHVKEGYTEEELRCLLGENGWEVVQARHCMLFLTRIFKWLELHHIPPHGLNWILILENLVPIQMRICLRPYDVIVLAKKKGQT